MTSYVFVAAGDNPVYLVSSVFASQTCKEVDSGCETILLTTTGSKRLAEEIGIADDFDEIVAADFSGTPKEQSRFLKANIRRLIDREYFWYLDSDLALHKALPEKLDASIDVAGAEDQTVNVYYFALAACRNAGWQLDPTQPYINGGVMYWSNSDAAKRFGDSWAKAWAEGLSNSGMSSDQPSLNAVLQKERVNCKVLGWEYNAQLWVSPLSYKGAYVWHFGNEGLSRVKSKLKLSESYFDLAKRSGVEEARSFAGQCSQSESPWLEPDNVIYKGVEASNFSKLNRAKSLIGQAYGALDHKNFSHAVRLFGRAWGCAPFKLSAYPHFIKFLLVYCYRLLKSLLSR